MLSEQYIQPAVKAKQPASIVANIILVRTRDVRVHENDAHDPRIGPRIDHSLIGPRAKANQNCPA